MIDVNVSVVVFQIFGCLDYDLLCVDLVDDVVVMCYDGGFGIVCNCCFYVGVYEWSFGVQQWYGLMLYVCIYQSVVGVVVFKEWDQGCSD